MRYGSYRPLGVKEYRKLYHKANWGLKKITCSDLDQKDVLTPGKNRRSQRDKEQLRGNNYINARKKGDSNSDVGNKQCE